MKDLYTFDYSAGKALETYEEVCKVYKDLFNELKLPYLVADADSGNMGGNLSHEFHFPSVAGEDNIISCNSCQYVANEELAEQRSASAIDEELPGASWYFEDSGNVGLQTSSPATIAVGLWRGLSLDRSTLVNAWYPIRSRLSSGTHAQPGKEQVNTHAIKKVVPDLDAGVENATTLWTEALICGKKAVGNEPDRTPVQLPNVVNLVDRGLPQSFREALVSNDGSLPQLPQLPSGTVAQATQSVIYQDNTTEQPLSLLRIQDGDVCPRCSSGELRVQKAIELGHTFFLGTRYSTPLQAMVVVPADVKDGPKPPNSADDKGAITALQMGCHGIGVTRMIAAVAESLADEKGLNWPRVMAPYETVVVPSKGREDAAVEVYDALAVGNPDPMAAGEAPLDVILDDRTCQFAWKMNDADQVGYPVIVVVGRRWAESQRMCEVQCRRLKIRTHVPLDKLSGFVADLLRQL